MIKTASDKLQSNDPVALGVSAAVAVVLWLALGGFGIGLAVGSLTTLYFYNKA